jgi:hypothetical protein
MLPLIAILRKIERSMTPMDPRRRFIKKTVATSIAHRRTPDKTNLQIAAWARP